MNTKMTVKILIDILMTVLYIVLSDAYRTGLTFHEIAGLSIFFIFIFHLILNWSWIKNITKNLFNAKLRKISRLQYVLNLMLFICIFAITITGIMISQVLFPIIETANNYFLVALHKYASYYCLGLLIFHIALHWRYLIVSIGKIATNIKILRFGATIIIVGLLYSQIIAKADESFNSSLTQNTQNPKEVISEKKSEENTDNVIAEEKVVAEEKVSLADFLGNMYCTACPKHCPLLNPKCGRAQPQINAAKIEYQKIYGD